MANQKNSNLKRNFIIGLIILGIFGIGYLQFSQSILSNSLTGRGITNEVKSEVWKGYDVELQSSFFGSQTSSPSVKIRSNPSEFKHFDFCNDNDGTLNIKNKFSLGEEIELSSYMSSSDKSCNQFNYIKASVLLPKGTLIVSCDLKELGEFTNNAHAECGIVGKESSILIEDQQEPRELSESFEVELEGDEVVVLYLRTRASGGGAFANAVLSANFEEFIEPVVEVEEENEVEEEKEEAQEEVEVVLKEVECNANIECQSNCGTKVPTCEDGSCFCSGEQLLIEVEKENKLFYLIPVVVFGLLGLIIWQMRKKPKK